ncbi:MAG: hypothetical protein IT177_00830 [Acidobacteria bacterium]|nr:hypothetical protein [Acidobacteriota bacterium]
MRARRLPAAVRAALADALTPHALTPALDRALAAALAHYQAAGDSVTAGQWARRRAALARAAQASTALLEALDAVDRAWQQPAPPSERGGWFVSDAHGALRRETLACTAMWRDWIGAPHAPRTRPSHRPSDARRHQLALAILFALQDARVPIAVHRRQRSIAEEVLRVVFRGAGAPLGRDAYRQMRTWMTRARQVTLMIERRRPR